MSTTTPTLTQGLYLPTPADVRAMLEPLTGRDLDMAPGPPFAPGPHAPATVAAYISDQGVLRATVTLDLALSAALGGSLALTPPSAVAEAVAEGALSELMREGLDEVANIVAALFNQDNAVHLRLDRVYHPGAELPRPVRAHCLTLGKRLDLSIAVAGYGAGRFGLACDLR